MHVVYTYSWVISICTNGCQIRKFQGEGRMQDYADSFIFVISAKYPEHAKAHPFC
jgi:hypothetical protein